MEITVKQGSLTEVKCDVLIVNLFEGVKVPSGATGAIDKALDGLISDYVIKEQGFEGKFGEAFVIPTYGKLPAKKVLIAGLGKLENFTLNRLRHLSSKLIRRCTSLTKTQSICSVLHGAGTGNIDPYNSARMMAEGSLLGHYSFDKYKSEKGEDKKIKSLEIVEIEPSIIEKIEKGIKIGSTIAEATNSARELVNEPASVMTPSKLAEVAQEIKGLETRVLEEEDAKSLGMGAFLAVGKGSYQPSKFIHMKYKPSKAKKKIAIVGKGVTFDSGGLDLKPAASMVHMKDDMAGSAAVIGTMKAIAQLKPDVEVHGIIAATENMPGSCAYKPGDVLKAMNGKTIEIDNTDAEGRLTLADALCYAVDLNVDEVIDIATLTGACLVALGYMASGIMGNDDDLIENLVEAGQAGGERLWQLPMYEEYFDGLKSDVADFKNSGSRFAGSSVAGLFLKEFVGDTKWAHIDIAGPAFTKKDIREMPKGPTGAGVRTLVNYIIG